MDQKHNDVLISPAVTDALKLEFFNVTNYLERLLFILNNPDFQGHLNENRFKSLLVDFLNSSKIFARDFLSLGFQWVSMETKMDDLLQDLNEQNQLIEIFFNRLNLQTFPKQVQFLESQMNLYFQLAFDLHLKLKMIGTIEVHVPRFIFATVERMENTLPLFQIHCDDLAKITNFKEGVTSILGAKKDTFYERHLKKGHFFLLHEKFPEAEAEFLKAHNLKTTAEILTLLGHLAYKKGKITEAKNYCLKALKINPEYGAALNDFGVYLLNEGNAYESILWFQSAKISKYYLNRDFAYINLGRAYMVLDKYDLALDELEQALAINPTNDELHKLVHSIKEKLEDKLIGPLTQSPFHLQQFLSEIPTFNN